MWGGSSWPAQRKVPPGQNGQALGPDWALASSSSSLRAFFPLPALWPALPSAPDSAHPTRTWLRLPSRGRGWLRPLSQDGGRRPAAEGRGGPGGAALSRGRGIRRGVTGKLVRVPGVSPCGSRGSAGRCPGSSPPSGLHRPPRPSFCPRQPWSSRQRPRGNERWEPGEGGRRRRRPRAGAARPGGTATPSATAGPGPGALGVGRQVRVPGRVCPQAEGARGEAEPRLSREAGLVAWKVAGQRRAPRGRTPGPGGLFPPGKFTKPGDAKLGN